MGQIALLPRRRPGILTCVAAGLLLLSFVLPPTMRVVTVVAALAVPRVAALVSQAVAFASYRVPTPPY